MSTCKDCAHVDICEFYAKTINNGLRKYYEPEIPFDKDRVHSEPCELFKDRSRFVELHHAEWVEDEDMYGDPIYRCSNCNEHFVLEEGTPTDNCYSYCPNCGAKMDEHALKEREENAK